MLISFQVANYRSFVFEQRLSMLARAGEAGHPSDLIKAEGASLFRTAAIFGSNASGKSNFLEAIRAVRHFVLSSATGMNIGDQIPGMVSFWLDKTWRDRPSSFVIEVLISGVFYKYAFSATKSRVHSESLAVRMPGGRLVNRFSRRYHEEEDTEEWSFAGIPAKDKKFLQEKTRENGLLLSRAAELNFPSVRELYLWFKTSLWTLDLSDAPEHLTRTTAERIQKDVAFRRRILRMLKDADLGISDLEANPETVVLPEGVPEEVRNIFLKIPEKHRMNWSVTTTHFDSDDKPVLFSMEKDESNGTQRFFALAGPILDAVASGATIVADELDCSLHPNLTRKIVEVLNSSASNPGNAQLIFATHDSSLMTNVLFRNKQIWLADKAQGGGTTLFSLNEIEAEKRPRKKESLLKNYLSGAYGGVPLFGPVYEDLMLPE